MCLNTADQSCNDEFGDFGGKVVPQHALFRSDYQKKSYKEFESYTQVVSSAGQTANLSQLCFMSCDLSLILGEVIF